MRKITIGALAFGVLLGIAGIRASFPISSLYHNVHKEKAARLELAPGGAYRRPWFTRSILEVEIAGRTGDTPYLVVADWPAVALSLLLLVVPAVFAWRRARMSETP